MAGRPVIKGLQPSVLRLSTVGCTVIVGKCEAQVIPGLRVAICGVPVQQDSAATDAGQLLLQSWNVFFAQLQL